MAVKIKWILKVYLYHLIIFVLVLDVKWVLAQCHPPIVENGYQKPWKLGKKILRYQCKRGYSIYGSKTITCKGGNFDSPPPICMKSGCPSLPNLKNGLTGYLKSNAIALYFCNPGFQRQGEDFSYCNGKQWNGTMPTCLVMLNNNVKLACGFEDDSLCGWRHDPINDFDWRRQNRLTPSFHIFTGPEHDHTYGNMKDGYYMYIEGDSAKENDTARLISPLYPPSLTDNGCFVFFYHMYGKTIGTLKVYQIPESIMFSEVVGSNSTDKRYTMFEKSGNQGDMWYRGFFDLDEFKENFQIIIEGIRGPGIVSDIAIDDVAILQSDKCVEQKSLTIPPVGARDSCLNRCTIDGTLDSNYFECECSICCVDTGTCCVDYREVCLFGDTSTQESLLCGTESSDIKSTDAPMLPSPQMLDWTTEQKKVVFTTSVPTTLINTTKINTTTSAPTTPPTITTDISKPTTKIPTTPKVTTTTSTTPKPTTSMPTTTPYPTTVTVPTILNSSLIYNATLPPKTIETTSTNTTESLLPLTLLDTSTKYIDTSTKFYKAINRHEYGDYNASVKFIQDAHEADSNPEVNKSQNSTIPIVISSILIIIGVAVAAVYAVKKLRYANYTQATIWRLQPRSGHNSSSDMRFLVDAEELEHEY